MKKLKPILLAAAALGGLALMASAALLDLPGGFTGLMCGMGGALLGRGGSSVFMGAVERHMSPQERKELQRSETDERSQRLTAQAAQLAGVATFFLQALAAFVLVAVDPMLVKVLLGSMLAYILFFLGARAALARRR